MEKEGNLSELGANATNVEEQPTPKKRGGARPGAGRKKVYESKWATQRLKCRKGIADLANAMINAIGKWPRDSRGPYPCRLDGEDGKTYGSGLKTWDDDDAILSDFSLMMDGGYGDPKIFALAFVTIDPRGVRVHYVDKEVAVLRWQRPDELAAIFTKYGSMFARRNNLRKEEKEILAMMPERPTGYDLKDWIEEYSEGRTFHKTTPDYKDTALEQALKQLDQENEV